ncbi:MAG: glycosyltransferase [Fibrobacter sp.]|nr:glycosyltransferase [Fibrobacter sp.]
MRFYNDISLITANFNNPDLTRFMIKSFLNKGVGNIPITIIDNSNAGAFNLMPVERDCEISVVNNNNYKLTKNWGVGELSKNHAHSLDYAIKHASSKWVIICDNDILFKPAIIDLLNEIKDSQYAVIGEIGHDSVPPSRLFPYLCIINKSLIDKYRINFFDPKRCMIKFTDPQTGMLSNHYDTGYSFLEDVLANHLPIKKINLDTYCTHFLHASQNAKGVNKEDRILQWIVSNKHLIV